MGSEPGIHDQTGNTLSRAKALRVLQRAGLVEAADQLATVLPDPVDLDRDANLLARFGITRDGLINLMGGSP